MSDLPAKNSDLPASPLRDIIRRQLGKKIEGGPLAKIKARMDHATDEIVILCDVSGSMSDTVVNMRKIDHLRIALRDLVTYYPNVRIIEFGGQVREVKAFEVSEPNGGTPLFRAMKMATKYRPKKTVIISDGYPDTTEDCLEEADRMTGQIDTIYCGPETDPAILFMQQLTRISGGETITWDGTRKLGSSIRGLLPPG